MTLLKCICVSSLFSQIYFDGHLYQLRLNDSNQQKHWKVSSNVEWVDITSLYPHQNGRESSTLKFRSQRVIDMHRLCISYAIKQNNETAASTLNILIVYSFIMKCCSYSIRRNWYDYIFSWSSASPIQSWMSRAERSIHYINTQLA